MNRLNRMAAIAATLWLAACTDPAAPGSGVEKVSGDEPAPAELRLFTLADFPVGVAVPADPWPNSLLQSPERQTIVIRHFNSLTAENIMKMAYLQPERGHFSFADADALVDFAERYGMIMHGHALVWHTQAPDWMNELSAPAAEFRDVLTTHIRTVAAYYASRMESWDVVNEAFLDEVPTEYRDTIWYRNLGPDYIELAFRTARDADPDADLYYNDYDISGAIGPQKLDRILVMIDDFLERGVPIDGIGFQMHVSIKEPSLDEIRESLSKAVARGIKVRLSELDIAVNPDNDQTVFTPALAAAQRQHYEDVVRIYRETVPPAQRGGITLWGITDGDSWIPGFRNRPDWPLLFDAEFQPKPALQGMADGLQARVAE